MSIVTTSSRGQIVIPKDVRKKLQIGPGRRLLIRAEGDRAVILPLPERPVEDFCGVFGKGPSLTRALLEERKKERRREAEKSAG
jgi:AbrB family looped-hinge helix DNA binding protein